jgi:hydroxyacylglutathione hydrolase
MHISVFPSGDFLTNAMVLSCEKTREAVVIDPAPGSKEAILSCIKEGNLTPVAIWLTHSHFDHIGDLASVKKALSVPVYVHSLDKGNVEAPGSDGLPYSVPETAVDGGFRSVISFGECMAQVIETPGHTPGGVCFYFPKESILIAGDTLFDGSIGRIDLPTAEPEKMWQSLAKLAKLPEETRFYPGHGPDATIGGQTWLPQAKQLFGE